MQTCRVCGRPAKWVLTNVHVAHNPFICGRHARAIPYNTMNKIGFIEKKSSPSSEGEK